MRTAIVVGGGIGGLSAARALELTGWRVTLYEQAPEFRPAGAGIGIAPNAVRALRWLGVDAPLRAAGTRQDGLEIRHAGGRRLARFPGADLERRFADPFLALHRAELHRVLLDSLATTELRTDHRATRVVPGAGGASVAFDTPAGPRTATADLVVAADGVHSRLRAALFPDHPGARYAGYAVWRGIVPADRAAPLRVAPVLTETWGRAARFGIAVIDGAGQVYWFGCETAPEGAGPGHDLAGVAARFAGWHPPIPGLLAATPPVSLLRHEVHYLGTPLPTFTRGRVVLLGDAAHAVTPDIGQGACLAVEDAVVLAAALRDEPVDQALASYDTARRPRTQRLAAASGRLATLLQLPGAASTRLRDTLTRAVPAPLFARFAAGAFAWTPPPARPLPTEGATR